MIKKTQISILLITHEQIGSALLDAVIHTLGKLPLPTTVVPVDFGTDPDVLIERLQQYLDTLAQNDGVLILTDLFGSTPCNIANRLNNPDIQVITGLNLPMLIRIMNYPELDLTSLAYKAVSGGREGIINCCERPYGYEKSTCCQ